MKRIALAVVVAGLIAVVAVPALAQPRGARDPFEPRVTEQTLAPGTQPGEAQPGVEPGVQPAPQTPEQMPATGAETQPWLVAAYALVAFGAGALVLSRTLRPA